MKGTILYGPRDARFEGRDEPKIIEPDPNSKDESNPSGVDRREKNNEPYQPRK